MTPDRLASSAFITKIPLAELGANLELFGKFSIYQDWRWLKIINEAFGHESFILKINSQGLPIAHLPISYLNNPFFGKSLISLPFLNAGGDLSKDFLTTQALLNQLIEELKSNFLPNIDYLELRCTNSLLAQHPDFVTKTHKVTFILPLPTSADALFSQLSTKLRAQIRRPTKEGATVKVILGSEVTASELAIFYQVMARHWRDLGSPIYPKKFFELVIQQFRQEVFLTFVTINNRVTSVGLTIKKEQTAEILWAASLREYHSSSPNMLMYWATLEYLCQQEIKEFDFGRCSKDSGTYHFKKQWGGDEKQLYWYYLKGGKQIPQVNSENPKFKLAVAIWKRLPVPIATFLGSRLSRFFP